MEDYNKVLDATEVAENANGVAAEKMTVYNESLAAAQNRLTASIQQFAQDSNLDQILAKAYDALSKIVDILNLLINKSGILSPLIKALGAVLATAFAAGMIQKAKETGGAIDKIIKSLNGFSTGANNVTVGVIPALKAAFTGLQGVITGTTTVTQLLSSVMAALGGPVGVAVAAVGAFLALAPAVTQFIDYFKNGKENALEKSTSKLEDSQKELEEAKNNLDEINDKIAEIDEKGTLTLADKEEKRQLEEQKEILKQIYEYKKQINEENEKQVKEDTGAIMKERYASGMEEFEEAYQSASKKRTSRQTADQYTSTFGTTPSEYYDVESASVAELTSNIKLLREEQDRLTKADGEHGVELESNNEKLKENISQLRQKAVDIGEDISKMKELGLTDTEYYKNAVAQYDQLQIYLDPSNWAKLKLEDLIDDSNVDAKLNLLSTQARNAVSKAASDSSQEAQKAADDALDKLDKSITDSAYDIAEKISKDDELSAKFAEAFNVDPKNLNVDEIANYIQQHLSQAYGNISKDVDTASSSILTSNGALKDTSTIIDELGEREVEVANKTKTLSESYNAMIKNGKLTSTQMKNLIKEYPELASAIEVQNGAIRINVQLLKDKYKEVMNTEAASIQAQIDETNVVIDKTQARIKAYQAELAAMTEVLVGSRYVQNTVDETTGMAVDESSKSVESVQSQLDYQIQKLQDAQNTLTVLQGELQQYKSQNLEYTGSSTGGSSTSQKSKEEKEFEDSVKDKMKNLGSIVKLYATQEDWFDQSVINKFKGRYQDVLKDILGDSKSRKIVADALNLNISEMDEQEAIDSITKLLQEQYGTIDEKQQELTKKYIDNKEKEIKATKEAEEAEKKRYDAAIEAIEDLEDITEEMIEKSIDLLDKAGSFVFDLLGKISDRYDKQTDNLDEISDKLDDQKDAFEDKIDKQKELLKLQKQEADNADELADKNKAIADIDAQLMELQYDDSAEAQAKRLKLLDERAEKEKDLADWQKDNDYDAKIDALDKEKSDYEKTIEVEKKALEAQKKTIEDAQKSFENTLSTIQNGFNSIIKILSSDTVKNLLTKALISYGGENFENMLKQYNRIFGDGLDETVDNYLSKYKAAMNEFGFKPGQWIDDIKNWLKGKSNTQQGIIDSLDQASDAMSTLKDQVETGSIDLNEAFNKVIDINKLKQNIANAKTAYGDLTSYVQNNASQIGKSMQGIGEKFAKVGSQLYSKAVELVPQLASIAQKAVGTVGSTITQIAAKFGLTSLGGAATTAAAGTATTAAATTGAAGVAGTAGTAAVATGGVGALPAIAAGGALALGTYGLVKRYKEYAKVWSDKDKSFGEKLSGTANALWEYGLNPINLIKNAGKDIVGLFKKHHTGADYVKKQNPELDRMLGLGDDETVSILKVGEAVVPTWANNASANSSNNSYTGSPFGSAVDSAVKSAKASSKSSYSSSDSSINISMPISIQGDADASTVKALQKEANNIVNKVLKTINNQTKIGGYKNIKAATV